MQIGPQRFRPIEISDDKQRKANTTRMGVIAASCTIIPKKCNVEMVFSGQMNNIIESHFVRTTDCMRVALANLPCGRLS